MTAYYNENDPKAASWLRELILEGLVAPGVVDERSILDVAANDLTGYDQCHFFAGIGGWSYALRLAGWPDDRPVWTGSCPCQPHSSASRGRKVAIDLWPEFRRLIDGCRPAVVFGEQVDEARAWMDGLCDDMEAMGYTVRAKVLPAYCVAQDHSRERIYFACHTDADGQSSRAVHEKASRLPRFGRQPGRVGATNGVSRDVVALSGFGNAIVPQVAAEFVRAMTDTGTEPSTSDAQISLEVCDVIDADYKDPKATW